MSDDVVKQSIAELQDLVRCRCHEAYTGRGLHDPNCECDSADAVKTVVERIEDLEAKLAKAAAGLVLAKAAINGFVDSGDAFDEIKATLAELTGKNT